jgi:hypothetical protein
MPELKPEIIRSCETCDWIRDNGLIKAGCCDPANDCSGLPDFDHWRKKQLTPAEEQQYVRDHWKFVFGQERYVCIYWSDFMTSNSEIFSGSWHEAYLFTLEQEKQIARREKSVGMLKECLPGDGWHDAEEVVIAGEILAREQAALAEMKKGWRE